jgi:hypothetical protein
MHESTFCHSTASALTSSNNNAKPGSFLIDHTGILGSFEEGTTGELDGSQRMIFVARCVSMVETIVAATGARKSHGNDLLIK